VTKNRFGSNAFISLNLTQHGFDLDKQIKPNDPLNGIKTITMQQAVSMFGTYYKAHKVLSDKGFVKKSKKFVRS
jgi:hypothetical protein